MVISSGSGAPTTADEGWAISNPYSCRSCRPQGFPGIFRPDCPASLQQKRRWRSSKDVHVCSNASLPDSHNCYETSNSKFWHSERWSKVDGSSNTRDVCWLGCKIKSFAELSVCGLIILSPNPCRVQSKIRKGTLAVHCSNTCTNVKEAIGIKKASTMNGAVKLSETEVVRVVGSPFFFS